MVPISTALDGDSSPITSEESFPDSSSSTEDDEEDLDEDDDEEIGDEENDDEEIDDGVDEDNDTNIDEAVDEDTDSKSDSNHFVTSTSPPDNIRTSQFHFLIPASDPNIELCYNLVSSILNRYVPILVGYHGKGLFDAAESHLAKLYAIQRYLDSLEKKEDDDLVAIVDGYDIIMQLPAEVMVERYFEMANAADARLAERFGVTVAEARSRGIRQTVFWGPDKVCWPIDHAEARCWAVPESGLPYNAFGPKSGNGEMYYNDPRWLNSGTVIGPIADVRNLIAATLVEIEKTYNPKFVNSESDQFYLSNVWGRQEYYRSLQVNGGSDVDGPDDKKLPTETKETEYHISIDYESLLFQTKAGYEPFFGYLQFNQSGVNAVMDQDFTEGKDPNFEPYGIQMPPNVVAAMTRLFDDISHTIPGVRSSDWLRDIRLGTNFVTKHIYALWHCTASKEWIALEFPNLWFFPHAKPLMKAAIKASQEEKLLTTAIIDGRRWATKLAYPAPADIKHELGGSWSDENEGELTFVGWEKMCAEHEKIMFLGGKTERGRVSA